MSADHSRSGLVRFVERYPRFAGHAYLISPRVTVVSPRDHPSGIGTIPLDMFLIAVGRQAEAAMMQRLLG